MTSENFFLLKNKTGKTSPKNNRNRIILNTTVRLLRNITGYKFTSSSSGREKSILLEKIKKCVEDIKELRSFRFLLIKNLQKIQRDLLLEDYMISTKMADKVQGKGLFIRSGQDKGESLSIAINQEDHLMIQSVRKWLNILEAYHEVNEIESHLESKLNFAFDENLGYLTTSPINLGTALKISFITHLPVMAASPRIAEFVKKLNQVGCIIHGYFMGDSEVIGNLFKISNTVTLGKGEEDIVEEIQAICLNIIDDEQNARRKLKKNDLLGIKDNIYRSFGLLKYAKILSYEESVELLSIIRLGLDLDLIGGVEDFDYFELINKIRDPYIILDQEISEKVNSDRLDSIRADLIREKILKESG